MRPFLRPVREPVVGGHLHRSGWPYAMQSLEPLFREDARVVFDDFLEKTILAQREGLRSHVHRRPWVGFCHYPYDTPSWYETEHLRQLPERKSWRESVENLRLCFTLGENLRSWVRTQWDVPCVSLKHPSEIPPIVWSEEAFLSNDEPLLLQVGWYLRNTHAIFQVESPPPFSKAWLRSRRPIAELNHLRVGAHFHSERIHRGSVKVIEPVDNDTYDILLSRNVVFIELITSVANNTIVECIARNTPVAVNRHPGPEHYLGENYPLFYDDLGELRELLRTPSIIAAHKYLRGLDKRWLSGAEFREGVARACKKYVPEIRE